MAPTLEQALRSEIQAHRQALDHALATLKWLTVGHTASTPSHGLTCRTCEERDYIRLHLAGWATPTEGETDG